jgi:Zn-dependent protease with chaperone function
LVLHHLGQYQLADRPTAVEQFGLDRGPGVLAVVATGAAARAGLQAGDVLLKIDGAAIPPETHITERHDQRRARARADEVSDLLDAAAADGALTLTVSREGAETVVHVTPEPGCPSRVHLARSSQLNAFADGSHVLLTTRLLTITQTDDELAFVIAHEMAHNILGHAAEMRAMKREKKGLEGLLVRPALTRRTEREADRLAADLLLDSGYTITGAERVLHALDRGFTGPRLLANHDSMSDRAAALRAHAAARAGSLP